MKTLSTFLVSSLAMFVSAWMVPGVEIKNYLAALLVVIILSLINLVIKPVILFLTLPLNILTLGLFTFVINALMISLAAFIAPGFTVSGFWAALLFSLVLSLIVSIFDSLLKNYNK